MRTSLYIFLTVVIVFVSTHALNAQQRGPEPHRTRLIAYPTAEAAKQQSLTRQRYMQPIEEWTEVDGVLRGEFTFPFSWLERQVVMRVEGVAGPYEVWINGKRAASSQNGFAAQEFNITKVSKEDKNRVELRMLDAGEVMPIECFERGESKPVIYIISQPRVRVRDVAWRTDIDMGGVVNANFSVVMQNQTLGNKSSRLYYELYLNDTIRLTAGHLDVALGMYGVDTMRFGAPVPDSVLWSASSPSRLSLRLKNRIEGRDVEFYDIPVGLRKLTYDKGVYMINDQVCGMHWSEISPMSTVEQLAEAYAQGVRAVRFTAGWVRDELLDYCDAQGIYVAVTAPINSSLSGESRKRGGNPSNNPRWVDQYVERTVQMIHTTKRHPSVVAYYLADDSANGICLYESYLAACAISDRPVFYLDGGEEWNSADMY